MIRDWLFGVNEYCQIHGANSEAGRTCDAPGQQVAQNVWCHMCRFWQVVLSIGVQAIVEQALRLCNPFFPVKAGLKMMVKTANGVAPRVFEMPDLLSRLPILNSEKKSVKMLSFSLITV